MFPTSIDYPALKELGFSYRDWKRGMFVHGSHCTLAEIWQRFTLLGWERFMPYISGWPKNIRNGMTSGNKEYHGMTGIGDWYQWNGVSSPEEKLYQDQPILKLSGSYNLGHEISCQTPMIRLQHFPFSGKTSPPKQRRTINVILGLCSNQQLFFFTLLDNL